MRAALSVLALTTSLAAGAPQVQEAPLRAHLALLADDLFEGRGSGQRGAELTVRYLETQLQVLGLQPLKGSYRQPVKLAGTHVTRTDLHVKAAGGTLDLDGDRDGAWCTGLPLARQTFDAPLVFVGYGITAPDHQWDDYKGFDVKGKVLVALVNDPQPTADEPGRFGGKALTYYGRWIYKFEEAKRQGALGVLLVHTTPSATYGWSVVRNSFATWRFQLAAEPGLALQSWITEDAARRLCAAGGRDLDALRAAAERRDFRPVELGARLQGAVEAEVKVQDQYNVAGVLPGTDPKLKDEVVIYSAHWDHFGRSGKPDERGDDIYNGAVDNASGCAGLLAMAQAAVPRRRSQMFLFTAAEEQGLWGSLAYVAAPLWPIDRTVADLNLDSLNWVGATSDMGVAGAERTTLLESAAQVARAMGLALAPPTVDVGGGYFRSDHFPFAKAGVPAFSVGGGRTYLKDPEGSRKKAATMGARYHQVTDEYDPAWDLSGMVQQCQFALELGARVADEEARPAWKEGRRP
ncbi:MAG TPA: M28 family peptidase [Holophaga sp.]|nr:M28 family peptidase [Holophaga sp.]